jgi:T-complex protein 1 subunit gamma
MADFKYIASPRIRRENYSSSIKLFRVQIDVSHPAAKSMIELSRAQDEEVGDGTTSVIILAGEVLSVVEGFLEKDIHPTTIVAAYFQALEDIKKITEEIGVSIRKI